MPSREPKAAAAVKNIKLRPGTNVVGKPSLRVHRHVGDQEGPG